MRSTRPRRRSRFTASTRQIGPWCSGIYRAPGSKPHRQPGADGVCARGVPRGSPLGPDSTGAWGSGSSDPASIRQAVRQAQQERPGRCGGDLRTGGAAGDARGSDPIARRTIARVVLRVRERLVQQRTQPTNPIGCHAAKFGLAGAGGPCRVAELMQRMRAGTEVPAIAAGAGAPEPLRRGARQREPRSTRSSPVRTRRTRWRGG